MLRCRKWPKGQWLALPLQERRAAALRSSKFVLCYGTWVPASNLFTRYWIALLSCAIERGVPCKTRRVLSRPRIPAWIMNSILNITQEILAIARGDDTAVDNVVEGLYEELCRIAESQLSRANPERMVASDLVHELYLKLTCCSQINASGRQHFLSIAATAMRQLVIDQIKAQGRFKRGGNLVATTLSDEKMPIGGNSAEVFAVNRALAKLHDEMPILARTVECRYFAGYSELETAEALAISVRTVRRYWSRARKWLALELANEQ